MDNFDFKEYSYEVQEIMGRMPHWILRWGIFLIVSLLFSAIIFSCFFFYPEKLTVKVRIEMDSLPSTIIPSIGKRLDIIHIRTGALVTKGQVLAEVKSNLKSEDILLIQELLEHWKNGYLSVEELYRHAIGRRWIIGSFTVQFERLLGLIEKDLSYSKSISPLKPGLFFKQDYLPPDAALKKASLKQNLTPQKVYSTHPLQSILPSLFSKTNPHINTNSNKENSNNELRESASQLSKDIEMWKKRHIIVSPIAGYVRVSKNIHHSLEKYFFTITPIDTLAPTIYGEIPSDKIDRIEIGQLVYVQIQDSNNLENNEIKGYVKSLFRTPDNNHQYFIEVMTREGFKSNQLRDLPMRNKIFGTATIIIKEQRLIEYILDYMIE